MTWVASAFRRCGTCLLQQLGDELGAGEVSGRGSKVRRGARGGAARAADTSHGTRVRRGHVRSVVYRLGPTLNVKLLALNVGLMLFP